MFSMQVSFASVRVDPRGTHGKPGGIVRCLFFPCGGGELFGFGNDFAAPRVPTHGICPSFGQWYIALDIQTTHTNYFTGLLASATCKVKCALPGTMVDV